MNQFNEEMNSKDSLSIEDLNKLSDFQLAVDFVSNYYDFAGHPYFNWMLTIDKKSFLKSQLTYKYAVESFSCALSACLSRIPNIEKRMKLAENITEEHGHFDLDAAHKYRFVEFLESLGASSEEMAIGPSIGTIVFNESLKNFCAINCYQAGSCALGIIEHLFIGISSMVTKKVKANNWMPPDSQSHYDDHEVLDVHHAQKLFDIPKDDWDNPYLRSEMIKGLVVGAELFSNLYQSMIPK